MDSGCWACWDDCLGAPFPRCRIYSCRLFSAVVDVVVAGVVAVVLDLILFIINTSVDENYYPFLKLGEKVFERHGFV